MNSYEMDDGRLFTIMSTLNTTGGRLIYRRQQEDYLALGHGETAVPVTSAETSMLLRRGIVRQEMVYHPGPSYTLSEYGRRQLARLSSELALGSGVVGG